MDCDYDDEVYDGDDDDFKLYLQVRTETSMNVVLERHDWYLITNHLRDEDVLSPIPGMDHSFPWYSMTTSTSSSSEEEEEGSTTIFVLGGMKYARDFNWTYGFDPWYTYNRKADELYIPMWSDLWHINIVNNHDDNEEIGHVVEKNHHNDRWFHGERMLSPRAEALVVTIEREIFVFGGNSGYGMYEFAEVYDMDSKSWSEYTPDFGDAGCPVTELSACIVMEIGDNFGIEFDDKEFDDVFDLYSMYRVSNLNIKAKRNPRRVMLFYISETGCLYAYLMAKNSTRLLDSNFGKNLKNPFVLISQSGGSRCNNVLLTFKADVGQVWAYHIGDKKWFPVSGLEGDLVLPSLEVISSLKPVVQLLSLGGSIHNTNKKMCLIWAVCLNEDSLGVFFTKFTLCLDGFFAKVQPLKKFLIKTGRELIWSVVHNPFRGKKRKGHSFNQEQRKKFKDSHSQEDVPPLP